MGRLRGLRILLVDDNDDTQEMMAMVLGAEGATVVAVSSASEALATLLAGRFDVLLCDIGLPDVDGCELLRRIRMLPVDRGGSVPAVALTGYSHDEMRCRIAAAGYRAHVVKPFDTAALFAAIERSTADGSEPA